MGKNLYSVGQATSNNLGICFMGEAVTFYRDTEPVVVGVK